MTIILDASAAIEFVLNGSQKETIEFCLLKADQVMAPDIFISEVSNAFWKYHRYESLDKDVCDELLDKSIQLVDYFESSSALYRESFSIACQIKHPVYDALYIALTRRNNGILLSIDRKLNEIAESIGLNINK